MTDTLERTEAEAEQTAPGAKTSADADTKPEAIDDPLAGTSDHPAEAVDKATGEVVAVPTEADWLKIHAANQKVHALQVVEMQRREEHNAAKEALSAAQAELTAAIDRASATPAGTVFDPANVAESQAVQPGEAGRVAADESWKRVSCEELEGLPKRVRKAMGEAGLLYIGDIEKVRAELGSLDRMNGIGEASAELIESALLKFWSTHPAGIAARKSAPVPDAKASADATKNEQATETTAR